MFQKLFALVIVTCGFVAFASPASAPAQGARDQRAPTGPAAQRTRTIRVGLDCRIQAMPALPADADVRPPAARAGYSWEVGAYACQRGAWVYVPGHWERARANAMPNPLAMIQVSRGRVSARRGYEVVRQGSGPNATAVLRAVRQGAGGGAFAGATGTIDCSCSDNATGDCVLTYLGGGTVNCTFGTCTGGCIMIITLDLPIGGGIARRLELRVPSDCGPTEAVARRRSGVGHRTA